MSKNRAVAPASAALATVDLRLRRLRLRHAWTTTMSTSATRDTVHLSYTRDGITGHGEGAPIARYGRTPEQVLHDLWELAPWLAEADPWQFDALLNEARERLSLHNGAALAAVDLALRDWVAQRLGVPLYRQLGLDPKAAGLTSVSIGIDTPEITRAKVREAEEYPILKIKVGLDSDEETIAAVRSVTDKPLRVDANEGWTDPEVAIRKIRWLETQNVEMIEQPMPAAMLDEMRYVRSRVDLPIYADEACTGAAAIAGLVGAYDGINVKLDKAGGVTEAYRWIATARAAGLRVMLGCMVSSSCSCTAAAHLAPLADLCDLDGNLLIANDPFRGATAPGGSIALPDSPGLGLVELPTPECEAK
jgi:L-alanine-DL-glutamate epimerase-like enolase superfamily enzyme